MRTAAGRHVTARSPRSPRWDLMGHYEVTVDGQLHLDRLRIVQCPWFAVLLTRINTPDPGRDPHDHSRPFLSWILDGGYTERAWPQPGEPARSLMRFHRRWSVHSMPQSRAHRITAVMPDTLTLVFAGRHRGTWHFWTPEGPVDWKVYGSEDDD